MSETQQVSAKSVYESLKQEKQSYIDRAIKCAKLTIPALFPKEGATGTDKFDTPYQSVGARGVNNLTSKLILALFPPNEKFFRLGLSNEVKTQLAGSPDKMAEVDQALMTIEDAIIRNIEETQIRVTVQEAIKQLIISGNALIFLPPDKEGAKLYKLKDYVVQRDAMGTPTQIVTIDKVVKATIPEELQSMVADKKDDAEIEIYTLVKLVGENYEAFQEIDGQVVSGSEQSYPKDKSPYIPVRMTKQDGESYGRSFVEEYYGDLKSLEELSKAIVYMAMISATVIYLVNPNGITRPRVLAKANSGDFVAGRREDIQALQLDKYPDLQVARSTAEAIEQRLSFAFLLSSVVQRNADRVTAEEIRTVASELEDTLGGVYSILSQELQLPLIRRLMTKLMASGEIAQLPDGLVEPTITTGMEALGRGHDYNKYMTFISTIAQLPGALERLKTQTVIMSLATAIGIETNGLVYTDEEIQAMQQAQANQQLGGQAVMEAMKQDGQMAQLQAQQQAQQ